MTRHITLNKLRPGEKGIVRKTIAEDGIYRRFLDMGMTENTVVECVGISPMGDPHAYLVRGAVIAVRENDGCKIYVDKIPGGIS